MDVCLSLCNSNIFFPGWALCFSLEWILWAVALVTIFLAHLVTESSSANSHLSDECCPFLWSHSLGQEQIPKQSAGFTSGLLLRCSTECILYRGILVCSVNTWNYDNPLPQVNLWSCHSTEEGISETRSYCYGIKSSQSSPISGLTTIHTNRHTPYSLRWHELGRTALGSPTTMPLFNDFLQNIQGFLICILLFSQFRNMLLSLMMV